MSRFAMHQNAFAAYDDLFAGGAQHRAHVFCPKPRRLTNLAGAADPIRTRNRPDPLDSAAAAAAADLNDIFLSKGGEHNQVASSPPFYSGSPPTRSVNPLVHDARFVQAGPPPQTLPGPVHAQPAASPMKGCGPTKFGFKPAAVRIEGFECLDRRDRPNRSVTAVA